MIAGTSMGSLVGALYAAGRSPEFLRTFAESITPSEERKYIDITVPRMGMIRGNRIEQMLYTMTGGARIEDLNIPYRAVTCCVEDNQIVAFHRGDLTKAVRASIAIPGVFEPLKYKGKTYVDGGVLERVPVNVVKEMGADFIISVDVNGRGGTNPTPNNVFELMLTVFEMMEWQAMERRTVDSDVNILPAVRHINPASFRQSKECIDLGRAAALEKMDDIKQQLSTFGYSF